MRCILLKLIQQLLRRCAHDIVDFMNLVELIVSGEQGIKRQDLKKDTADTPDVHFVPIVAISHQALGRAVPPG